MRFSIYRDILFHYDDTYSNYKKDSIQYSIKFFPFTISQRSIPVESIEKIEKIKYTMKLHHKYGKNIHFAMYSPEFISAMEEFCAQHNISIVEKESKKNA